MKGATVLARRGMWVADMVRHAVATRGEQRMGAELKDLGLC